MRPDLSAGDETLLESGEYDLHWWVWVANGSGTLIDYSDRLKGVQWTPPSPDAPIAMFRAAFIREPNDDDTDSLSPEVTASLLNRLDDGVTFSPALQVGRDVVASLAVTARGAARPASASYEVFRGKVSLTGWPGRYGDAAITARDEAGRLEKEWIETPLNFEAGEQIEDVIAEIVDGSGGAFTLTVPVATGKGLSGAYTTGKQSRWAAIWSVAQSIGWVIWMRYQADGAADLVLFEPDRDKTTPDFTAPKVRDYTALEINEEDIRNVCEVEYSDEDGARLSVTVTDSGSISTYGGIRRYFLLSEPPESPVRSSADATTLGTAAVSDLRDPDMVATATLPLHFALECAVDLVTFPADGRFFDATQDLAPFSLTHSHEQGQDHQTSANVRGTPSGGKAMWQGRSVRYNNPTAEYGLIDFREVAPGTAGNRRWAWTRRGRQVDEVWYAFKLYAAPWADDNWADAKTFVVPIPDDEDFIEIANADLPDASKIGALWVEPRLDRGGSLTVYNDSVIERVKVMPVPASLDVDLSAVIASNVVDLTLKLTQAAGAKVYPAQALVYEGSESGTLLATFTFSADGTKTKTDDADLGGRSLPAEGKQAWVAVVTDVAGNVYRDRAEVNTPRLPYFDGVRSVLSADLLSVDIYGTVTDPGGLGGTLSYWLPTNAETPADPSGAATGEVVIAAADMPYQFDPTNVASFNDFAIAGSSFGLFLRFVATDGRTTGIQKFTLDASMQFLIDELGLLRAESVHNGLVLAQQYRPYFLGTGAPTLTPDAYGTNRYFDTAALQPYSHNGSSWAVDNSTPTVSYAPILRAGVVTTAVMDAEAVTTDILGANSVTAGKLASITMEVGKYIESNSYSAGVSGWRIEADGSAELNNVTVRGTVFATSGEFAGTVTSGATVAASDFTASVATFTNTVNANDVEVRNDPGLGTGNLRFLSTLGSTLTTISNAGSGLSISGDVDVGGDLSSSTLDVTSGITAGSLDLGGGSITNASIAGSLITGEVAQADNADKWSGNLLAGTATITDDGGTPRTVPYV